MNAAHGATANPVAPPRSRLQELMSLVNRRRGEILSSASMFTSPAVNMLYGFLVVRYLKPDTAGLLSTAALLPVYLTFLHLGVLNGMQRELPVALGAGDRERADGILRITTMVSLLAGTVSGGICLLVAAGCLLMGKPLLLTIAYLGSACVSFAYPVTVQIDTGLRAENRFLRQGWAVLGTNLVGLVTCALIPLLGAYGAVFRGVISSAGALLTRLRSGVWRPGGQWQREEVMTLARVGLPLLVSGTMGGFMMVADRTVVAMMMSNDDMGQFSLASLVVNSMTLVPMSLSLVLFPKIARAYGEHRSRRRLRRFVWISLIFNAVMIAPLCLVCFLVIQPVVQNFFPEYTPGIPAARLACVTCIFWVYLGVGSVIGVINRMTPYLCFLGFCLLLILGGSAVLIHLGHGIMGAAWARMAGTALMCLFTISYSLYLTSSDGEEKPEARVAA